MKSIQPNIGKLSFSALIQFPQTSYFTLIASMEGICTFNSVSLNDEVYSADISFSSDRLTEVVTAITLGNGTLVNIMPTTEATVTTPATVKTYVKKRKTVAVIKSKTKIEQMKDMLSTWKSVKDLKKATGWQESTIHARFTGLRKLKKLQSKNGPQGNMVYRLIA